MKSRKSTLFTATMHGYNKRTMKNSATIRMATVEDAPALLKIYLPYVRTTAITFELEDPTLEDFAARIAKTLQAYPYIVAVEDDKIIGYAYASPFRPRAAYLHSIETSIYMDMEYRGRGMGRRLYNALGDLLVLQNVYNMEACIAHCEPADEYVPATSRLFHEHLGFRLAGKFVKCAHKFNRWYDMIWMEKILGDHVADPEPFLPLPKVDPKKIEAVLEKA